MKNRLKIFHVRDGKRQMTVASEVSEDERSVRLGFAFCNDKDNFSRKQGVIKAIGRMRSETYSVMAPFTGHSGDSIVTAFNRSPTNVNIMPKPQKWRHGKLVDIKQTGLTFVAGI